MRFPPKTPFAFWSPQPDHLRQCWPPPPVFCKTATSSNPFLPPRQFVLRTGAIPFLTHKIHVNAFFAAPANWSENDFKKQKNTPPENVLRTRDTPRMGAEVFALASATGSMQSQSAPRPKRTLRGAAAAAAASPTPP